MLRSRFESVAKRVAEAAEEAGRKAPRLVAVSKRKPAEMVEELYGLGHRHFGENYVAELVEKAKVLPSDVCWHFIGTLQSNKAKQLVEGAPSLSCVETVTSVKLARKLESACSGVGRSALGVFVQVNTSGEEQKGGVVGEEELVEVVRFVEHECKLLQFQGLMTIGRQGEAADMERLVALRDLVKEKVEGLGEREVELSMGMSADFELAIALGATNVRIGSTIFGPRDPHAAAAATGGAGGGGRG